MHPIFEWSGPDLYYTSTCMMQLNFILGFKFIGWFLSLKRSNTYIKNWEPLVFGPLLAMDNNIAVSCLSWNPSSVIGKTKKMKNLICHVNHCSYHNYTLVLLISFDIVYYLDKQLEMFIEFYHLYYNNNNKLRVSWKIGIICLLLISKLHPFY